MEDLVMTDSAKKSATPAVAGAVSVDIDDVKKMSLGDGDKNENDPDKNDDDDWSEGTETILGSEDDFEDFDDGNDNGEEVPEGTSQKKESKKKSIDSSSKSTTAVEDAEEALIKAVSHKEEGNTYFKSNDYEKAATSYRRGVNLVKKLNHNNTGNEQIKSLLVQLQTNFSIVRYKQMKYKVSIDLASKALLIDKNYVKALYWRALAYRKVSEYEQAKIDLRAAIVVEPNNTACKKELQQIKKDLETIKETQKKALAKAFSNNKGNTSFLYNDKVEEEKRKELLALEKKQYEQELYKKRKSAWEDECVKRMTQNEKVESFEEYEKRIKDDEDKKQKDDEKKEKAAKKAANQQRKKNNSSKNSNINTNDDDDDDVLTEKELASMRGYKKTADGRTTSYFTRDNNVSDDLKQSLVAPPQRLDSVSAQSLDTIESPSSVIPRQQSIQSTTTSISSGHQSVWNQAQTWEEKDTTEWCKNKLKEHLLNCTCTVNNVQHILLNACITSVEEITGDASVAIVAGGKKRYIYDFHCKLLYEIKLSNTNNNTNNDNDTIVAKGVVKLPDICTGNDDIEVSYSSKWKLSPTPSTLHDPCMSVRTELASQLRTQVQCWIQDFNNQY